MKKTFASQATGLKSYVRRNGLVVKAIAEMRFGNDTIKEALKNGLVREIEIESRVEEPAYLLEYVGRVSC